MTGAGGAGQGGGDAGGAGEGGQGGTPESGDHLWSKHFGGPSFQEIRGLAAGPTGEVVIVGRFGGSADFGGGPLTTPSIGGFVAKFAANGAHVWSKSLGDGSIDPTSVAIDASGNASGSSVRRWISASARFVGDDDIFVVKLDAAGAHVWSTKLGTSADERPTELALDASGNLLLAGFFNGTTDLGGGPLVSIGDDAFAVKLDPAGGHLWSKCFGGVDLDRTMGIAAGPRGEVAVTGLLWTSADFGQGVVASAGYHDVFFATFDAAENPAWSRTFGSTPVEVGSTWSSRGVMSSSPGRSDRRWTSEAAR